MGNQHRVRFAAFIALLVATLTATALPATAASEGHVSVVVQAGSAARAAELVTRSGGTVDRELALIGGVAAQVAPETVARLDDAHGVSVVEDEAIQFQAEELAGERRNELHIDASNPGLDWSEKAGWGVGVALIDTGVQEAPELAGRVVHGPDYSDEGDSVDTYGHGTFMAGLIAGNGRPSDGETASQGLAPGAHIVSVKLAGRDGVTSLSKVLDAIGWVVTNRDEYGIRVLNLSLGVPSHRAPQADPLSAAVEAAWAAGITVVAASGNEGGGTVTSPGRDPWVVTVGSTNTNGTATTADDTVPSWSGSGRVTRTLKPEIVAPGASVISLRVPGSAIDEAYPQARIGDSHFRGSGTSMSTALVSGAVAALTEAHPWATPDDFKGALMAGGDSVSGTHALALDLAGADAAAAEGKWLQQHPIAFGQLDGRLNDGMPWAGMKWAGMKWADADFAGMKWAGMKWAGMKWAATPDFSGMKWAGMKWANTEFVGMKWADADFAGMKWAGMKWAGMKWADADFAGMKWAGMKWADADFVGMKWAGMKWAEADFVGMKWAGMKWAEADWAGMKWAEADWAGMKWAGGNWPGETWSGMKWAASIWDGAAQQ